MSYNMPLNLMSTAASPTGAQTGLGTVSNVQTTVQPAAMSTGSQSAANDHNTGGQASSQQQALTYKRAYSALNTAEPKSVVTAQAAVTVQNAQIQKERTPAMDKAMADNLAATQPEDSASAERVGKLDRYAPPDPLPTASILRDKPITPVQPLEE